MTLKRNNSTDESRQFWASVDKTAARVDAWPAWMKGDVQVAPRQADSPVKPDTGRPVVGPVKTPKPAE